MALETTDLLVVQRPATKLHYKVTVSDLTGSQLPDGFEVGQVLQWDGSEWLPSNNIDGGIYA